MGVGREEKKEGRKGVRRRERERRKEEREGERKRGEKKGGREKGGRRRGKERGGEGAMKVSLTLHNVHKCLTLFSPSSSLLLGFSVTVEPEHWVVTVS